MAGEATLIDYLAPRRLAGCSLYGARSRKADRDDCDQAGSNETPHSHDSARASSGDERIRHWVLAKRLAQKGPMHRLVAENGRKLPREVAFGQNWNGAKIGAGSAFLQRCGKGQDVSLGLQLVLGKIVILARRYRRAAQLLYCFFESIGMLLMLPLELYGQRKHRLLQETRFGTDLVGRNALVLQGQGGIQDRDVIVGHLGRGRSY